MDFLPILYELDFIGQDIEDLADIAWSNYQIDVTLKAAPAPTKTSTNSHGNESAGALRSSMETLQSVLNTKQGKYQSLNLHANKLTHLHSLPYLPNLTELNLSSNLLTSFQSFSVLLANQLPSLTHLDLSANQIHSLEGLPYLSHLTVFSMAFNQLRDVDTISQSLPNLEELDLRGNFIQRSADLDGLTELFQLRVLHIGSSASTGTGSTPSKSQAAHNKSSGVNTVCHRIPNMIRLFHACESLRTIDDKKLAQWEELFLRYNAAVSTPHFDKLAQRYRHTHSTASSTATKGTSRTGRDVRRLSPRRGHEDGDEVHDSSFEDYPNEEHIIELTAAGTRSGHYPHYGGGSSSSSSSKHHTRAEREILRNRSLSPSKSKVLFPGSDHHAQPPTTREERSSRSPMTRQSPAGRTPSVPSHQQHTKSSAIKVSSRDEPEEIATMGNELNALRLLTALDKSFFHHQQTTINRAFQHWKVETQYPRLISVIKTSAKIEAESETQVHVSQLEADYLALTTKYDLMIEEKTSLTAEYERKLLQEKTKADQQNKRYITQEGSLNELRHEVERLQQELQQKQQSLEHHSLEMEVLRSNFTYQRTEAEELRQRLEDTLKEASLLKSHVEIVSEELSIVKDSLQEKEQQLFSLQEEVKTFSSSHQLDVEIIHAKDFEIKELQKQLQEKDEEILKNHEENMNNRQVFEKEYGEGYERKLSLLQKRIQEYEEEISQTKRSLAKSEEKSSVCQQEIERLQSMMTKKEVEKEQEMQQLQHQQKLEQRLLKLQHAFEEISKVNEELHQENQMLVEQQKKDRVMIKDLTKCVKKLQEITDFRTSQDEIVQRIQQEKQELIQQMEELRRRNQELESIASSSSNRERDRMRQTSEQLTRLEEMVHELEKSKKHVEMNLSVKEVMIKDQVQEIQQWKEKHTNLLQELTSLRQEYRLEVDERDDQLHRLEEDLAILEEKLQSKNRVEKKMKEIIHNYIMNVQNEVSRSSSSGGHLLASMNNPSLSVSLSQELGLDLGRTDLIDDELVQLLASLEMTSTSAAARMMRKVNKLHRRNGKGSEAEEDEEEEEDDDEEHGSDDDEDDDLDDGVRRHTRKKGSSGKGRGGRVGIADRSDGSERVLDHIRGNNKENSLPTSSTSSNGGVCMNRLCQDRLGQLERLVLDYQQALERKSEECDIISDSLNRLEQKTREVAELMNTDKTRYEAAIEKYRSDKKKLTKLCKALEEDLIRKDQDLRKIHSTLKDLQSIPSASSAALTEPIQVPSSASSNSSIPVEVRPPSLYPPKPPTMLGTN